MEGLKLLRTNVIHVLMMYVKIILLVYLLILILFLILMLLAGLTTVLEPCLPDLQLALYFFSSPLTSSSSFHQQRPATTPFVSLSLF